MRLLLSSLCFLLLIQWQLYGQTEIEITVEIKQERMQEYGADEIYYNVFLDNRFHESSIDKPYTMNPDILSSVKGLTFRYRENLLLTIYEDDDALLWGDQKLGSVSIDSQTFVGSKLVGESMGCCYQISWQPSEKYVAQLQEKSEQYNAYNQLKAEAIAARNALAIMKRQYEQKIEEARQRISVLERNLTDTRNERDAWKKYALELEKFIIDLQFKLDSLSQPKS